MVALRIVVVVIAAITVVVQIFMETLTGKTTTLDVEASEHERIYVSNVKKEKEKTKRQDKHKLLLIVIHTEATRDQAAVSNRKHRIAMLPNCRNSNRLSNMNHL